jgi:NAD(P)H-dependent flavin oxidoreductase YrpB (nitropropane dioxygenase family)
MSATLAAEFGVAYPIFAFSHCRDVVAEVSRRGGFGVYGAASHTVDELDTELSWIDEHCGGKPYGIDVLLPARTADTGTMDPAKLRDELASLIPEEHRKFVRRVLEENGIRTRPIDAPFKYTGNLIITNAGTLPMIDIILGHPLCRFFVSALGTPRPDLIRRFHDAEVKVGALAGSVQHAVRHVSGGVDIVVAQGTEAGGHTGEIATMVLTPDVVDAVAPAPVLAAGGIGTGRQIAAALALGAKGVWTGSIWLTVTEAATTEDERAQLIAATASDTVRSKSMTGKPVRQIRSTWTDAWARPDAPPALQIPLQMMLVEDALADDLVPRGAAAGLARPIAGQIVGRMNAVRSVREVMDDLVEELVATISNLPGLVAEDDV